MSSKAYITAGLATKDTSTPFPSAMSAFLTAGLAASELTHTGYEFYSGTRPDNIDYNTIVGWAAPGETSLTFDLADGIFYIAAKAVSASGVRSAASRILRVEISGGAIVSPRPNALAKNSVRTTPGPGGKVHLEAIYDAANEPAAATKIQVGRIVSGSIDWVSPEQEINITGTTYIDEDLTTVYSDGELVELALRAVTADSVASKVTPCRPVVADATAPSAPGSLSAAQEGT